MDYVRAFVFCTMVVTHPEQAFRWCREGFDDDGANGGSPIEPGRFTGAGAKEWQY